MMKIIVKQYHLVEGMSQGIQRNALEYKVVGLVGRMQPEIGTVFSEDNLRRLIANVRYDDLSSTSEVEII